MQKLQNWLFWVYMVSNILIIIYGLVFVLKNMSKRTRWPNVAKKLVENSISAMLAAIEIHNKPMFSYRYETSVILFINARELLLKWYMYKNHPKVKLREEDEEWNTRPKPFSRCLSFVSTHLWKKYADRFSKIEDIYQYRCDYTHFYWDNLDWWVFMWLADSIKSYVSFVKEFFPKHKFDDSSLIIMPIWFKAVIDPIEFLSEISASRDSSKEVKEFIKSIIQSSGYLWDDSTNTGITASYGLKIVSQQDIKKANFLIKRDKDWIPFNQTKIVQIGNDKWLPQLRFSSDEEERKFYKDCKLSVNELIKKIWEKYTYKDRNWINSKVKEYKFNRNYAFSFVWESAFKYKETLVDIIGESFPDNPNKMHLKKESSDILNLNHE